MKKKNILISIMLCFLFIFLNGCSRISKTPEKNIDYLKNLDSYACDFKMKLQNDKQSVEYCGKQFYDKNYGYRFELDKDRVLIYKNNKIYINDLHNGLKYNTEKNFDSTFKLSFIGEFIGLIYTNEKVNSYFKEINKIKHQVIAVDIPGNNKNISKAELYLEAENAIPKYLIIYDVKNKEKIKVEYINFKFNPQLDKGIFEVQ